MTPVLCISRIALPPVVKDGVVAFSRDLDPNHIHFLNRSLADSKDDNLFEIAKQYPQLLPYIVVTCGDKYLTYARKGTEDRLHGKRSIGFGGHVEIADLENPSNITRISDLYPCAMRELSEELGLDVPVLLTDKLIFADYDNVSRVHVGVLGHCEVDADMIKPDNLEIIDPQWKTSQQIRAEIDRYERWSQLVIKL